MVTWPDWVPAATSRVWSPSRVSSVMLVPSAAAVMGSATVACRSSPRRTKVGWLATTISTYRSPAGPLPAPTSPSPASWIRVPVSTPAGIRMVSERRERTRPSPEHCTQGCAMTVP